MRQLRETAWMHNRVRMIVASFLVKDLHLHWTRGARHFMRYLADGDLASNQHGWQWAAGTGTDAAPFFRVFNPVSQGERFDPDGDYVRRFVPELRDVPGAAVHRPWELPDGPPDGYPRPSWTTPRSVARPWRGSSTSGVVRTDR
jgi:deoxyribodipyrimidine photo-lyase